MARERQDAEGTVSTGVVRVRAYSRPADAGFTVLELLISMSIMLGVTGAIFSLVNPSQGTFRVQPEVADMQQRLRVAADRVLNHLMMAGGGMYSGSGGGPLIQFFAPVTPYRLGRLSADPNGGVFFRDDAISLIYVPNTAAQTTTLDAVTSPSASVRVTTQAGCPTGDPLCGFQPGQTVAVFDDTGASDAFRVTGVQGSSLELLKQGQSLSKSFASGAFITEVETHTYHLDVVTNQLMHYDGWESDIPLVDDVVGLRFRYFGDPAPPTSPRPPAGLGNCLFTPIGTSTLSNLPASNGSLVELTGPMLMDGPWCGGNNRFDADLYRVRKIRVDLRMQVSAEDLRGSDSGLFRKPGSAVQGTRMVPDYEMSFDISPRNMNLAR